MLEARLITKLSRVQMLWELDWSNDAQDELKEAIAVATDTEWEDRLSRITEGYTSYEDLKAMFLSSYREFSEADLNDFASPAFGLFAQVCQDAERQWKQHVTACLTTTIDWLCTSIGDKIHRRNLQIADLNRQLRPTVKK